MKKKQNLFERTFNSLFRCTFKVIGVCFALMIATLIIFGTEVKADFSLQRVKAKVEQSFFGKLIDKIDIFNIAKAVLK